MHPRIYLRNRVETFKRVVPQAQIMVQVGGKKVPTSYHSLLDRLSNLPLYEIMEVNERFKEVTCHGDVQEYLKTIAPRLMQTT